MEYRLLILEPKVKVTPVSVGADPSIWQSHTSSKVNPANREDKSEMTDSCEMWKSWGLAFPPLFPPLHKLFSATWKDIRNPPLLVPGPKCRVTSNSPQFLYLSEKGKSEAVLEEKKQPSY